MQLAPEDRVKVGILGTGWGVTVWARIFICRYNLHCLPSKFTAYQRQSLPDV